MFRTRLISGIVLVIIAAVLLYFGDIVLLCGLTVISLIGLYELNKITGCEKNLLGIISYIFTVLYYAIAYISKGSSADVIPAIFFVAYLMMLMIVYVFAFPKYNSKQVSMVFFGLIYVSVMLSYIFRIRMLDNGYLVWLVFLASWGCDTCAYAVGILIGKHKMSPKLSPKKSIEGAVGGVAGSALLGVVFALVFKEHLVNVLPDPVAGCAIICVVGSLISMIGDLAASAIKRNNDIKDYGKLIPGHGGILDRFDSVIFVAPGIFYTILILINGIDIFKLFNLPGLG